MRRPWPLVVALVCLPGCASLNDALVRRQFYDSGYRSGVQQQITQGLRLRESQPPPELPRQPVPAFIDQG